jgi:hypothetical protein
LNALYKEPKSKHARYAGNVLIVIHRFESLPQLFLHKKSCVHHQPVGSSSYCFANALIIRQEEDTGNTNLKT